MYHGTGVHGIEGGMVLGDVEVFDRQATRRALGRESLDQVGAWFSDNPAREGGAGMYFAPGAGVIYPVYLAIENPWECSFKRMWIRAQRLSGQPDDARPNAASVDALRYWLLETGRDGIRIRADAQYDGGSPEFVHQDCWVALDARQIKSAIGNSGLYDPESGLLTDRPEQVDAAARLRASMDVVQAADYAARAHRHAGAPRAAK